MVISIATPNNPYKIQQQSLEMIAIRINDIKSRVAKGEISLIDERLGNIFSDLKNLIPEQDLQLAVNIFRDSTLILGDKLEEIFRYILQLTHREQLSRLLSSHPTEELLSALLMRFWQTPMQPPKMSMSFLMDCYRQLVLDKGTILPHHHIQDIPAGKEPEERQIDLQKEPFEARMTKYYDSIAPSLPCKYSDLFIGKIDTDERCDNFILFLHLLQNGKIHYSKTKDLIEKGDLQP